MGRTFVSGLGKLEPGLNGCELRNTARLASRMHLVRHRLSIVGSSPCLHVALDFVEHTDQVEGLFGELWIGGLGVNELASRVRPARDLGSTVGHEQLVVASVRIGL